MPGRTVKYNEEGRHLDQAEDQGRRRPPGFENHVGNESVGYAAQDTGHGI